VFISSATVYQQPSLAWFEADSARKTIDPECGALLDRIIAEAQ
jgi:hypothetical protein